MSFITSTHFPRHKLLAYQNALQLLVLAKCRGARSPAATGLGHRFGQ